MRPRLWLWIWPATACTFDPSGLAGRDAATPTADGSLAADAAAPPTLDAHPPDRADAPSPPAVDAAADAAGPDACVDVTCEGEEDCNGTFDCCHEGVCAEGQVIGGTGCVPADDWEPCP